MTQGQIDRFVELVAETGKVAVATDVYEQLVRMLVRGEYSDWVFGVEIVKESCLLPGTMIAYREPKQISLDMEAQDWLR